MSPQFQTGRLPFSNPLANALVAIVGVLAVGASIVLGFIAFVTLGALVLVLASIVGIRVWWFNRKLRRDAAAGAPNGPAERRRRTDVIEGEYRIVSPPDSERNRRKP